ncbi:argininosuccinate lyase [Halanaerobium sp. DL-01]|uniref:argininosuccinate lyase n=1 Tax=Halanaerobium sp. DL-01 TaxID=1653064 RepID=UPI000DF1B00A|nr:argininosuccinate lyase [Halanaerobium sp. DL-01]RCW81137.1 argininosuccinate lyase [Halanaerobium sp. DL-01]
MKLWGGRFETDTDQIMDQFNSSLSFDIKLMEYDIQGSLVHVEMLGRQGIISAEEANTIIKGLKEVRKDLAEETAGGNIDLTEAEDIHTLIEKRLTEKIGKTAGKMHTGRSRNDQVALDMRLYLRDKTDEIIDLIDNFLKILLELAEKNKKTVMPGYTHMQRAQVISFGHHLLAHYFKLKRDKERYLDCRKRINISPLGSGALAGSSFPLDRSWTAEKLNFSRPCKNSIDGVSDRDFIVEFLSVSANMMAHLSSMSEEIILWNSAEFDFIELDDRYTTGSSIMPQKKNPDLAELVRGKSGRVIANLNQILITIKGLPLAYNKDLQEDKEWLFDTVKTIKVILTLFPEMLRTLKVNKENMLKAAGKGYLNATELADFMAEHSIPFRTAHSIVGKAVLYAVENDKELNQLTEDEWKKVFPSDVEYSEEKLTFKLDIKNSLNNHSTYAGPSPDEVQKIIEEEKSASK